MDTKLTLRLDQQVIEEAKKYAKQKNISLSQLVESFLARLTQSDEGGKQYTPLVESLSGLVAEEDLRDDYGDHLERKYR